MHFCTFQLFFINLLLIFNEYKLIRVLNDLVKFKVFLFEDTMLKIPFRLMEYLLFIKELFQMNHDVNNL
jgi:hypothetical protein